jgi:hypothetical protein
VKIQFELGQSSHKRHQTSVIEALRTRGHDVVLTACVVDCPGLVEHKLPNSDHRNLLAFSAFIRDDEWGRLAYTVRTSRDYLRYLRPEHAGSEVIRLRGRNMLQLGFDDRSAADAVPWLELLDSATADTAALRRIDDALDTVERAIPPHPKMLEYVRGIGPDAFCVTPMLMTQYGQTDLIKAVRALGIPAIFLAGSWDNLTTKGTVHVIPDATLVWNEVQTEEAERFHGIPRETVTAAGAPRFDEYWERRIESTYENYCKSQGLDPRRPLITYLGSSNLIVKNELDFVSLWIDRIQCSSSAELASANLLLRPHPKFADGWEERFRGKPQVALSVSKVLNNDASLFDAMAHSRAVIGANTSAELEAAIVGCPVFTIKDPTFVSGQDGTIHFGYLAGDLAKVAISLDEHVAQLAAELGRPKQPGRNDQFLTSFLRPGGLNRRASDVTADAIERVVLGSGVVELARPTPEPRSPATAGSGDPLRSLMRRIRTGARVLSGRR